MRTLNPARPGKKHRSLSDRIDLVHRWNQRSGLYVFLIRNVLALIAAGVAILVLFIVLEKTILDLDAGMETFLRKLDSWWVLLLFFLSESFLGLLPPDFFILWAGEAIYPWGMLSVLALISYLGGTLSFLLGSVIGKRPGIRKWINNRLSSYFKGIKKWGGWGIVIAALFPLPYSLFSLVAGMLQYPLQRYLLFGIARIARFYLYALFLFRLVG